MACEEKPFADTLLYGVERVAEVFGVGAGGHVGADLAVSLCVCTAAEAKLIEREVDVVEGRLRLIGQHGADDFADVADFAAGGDNDSTRGNDLGTVGVFLGH